jgi:cytosine/adenosine deaminase-related metal-dependent hydrolase
MSVVSGVCGASGGAGRLAGQAGRLFKSRAVAPRSPGSRSPTMSRQAANFFEREPGRRRTIHTPQTPRSFSQNLLAWTGDASALVPG